LAEDLNVKKKRRSDRVLGRQGTPLAHSLPSILVLAVFSLATVGFAIWRIIDGRTSRANDHAIDHSVATIRFTPTVENKNPPPQEPPDGMIWIPGGEFSMGAQDPPDMNPVGMNATEDSRPVHRVYVDGFWMDQTDVTNKQFAKFVRATGYVTGAERKPRAEDFPTAPPENLVAGSVVFAPPNHPVPLNDHFQWWTYVKGADWRHPLGPRTDLKGKENLPGQISRDPGLGGFRLRAVRPVADPLRFRQVLRIHRRRDQSVGARNL
jgi:formylglycine-generating enzyme required for sulfatase activity